MLKEVPNGAVIVDVAVDQGGCIETTHPTTHSNPTYYVEGVLHYCVANMPGAVPRTSTFALTNATLPYALKLANKGFLEAIAERSGFEGRCQHLRRSLHVRGSRVSAGHSVFTAGLLDANPAKYLAQRLKRYRVSRSLCFCAFA